MTSPYLPILIFFACGIGFAVLSVLGLGLLLGPKRYNSAKVMAYECGIQPSPRADSRGRFPVKYATTAMLFIIFDVETIFLLPFAVTFDQMGLYGLLAMTVFLINAFFIADAYVWRRGGLDWD
ncbi:NADH-quinone oxidoreductase subunit A [Gephyromycinifex aptenodytis]|uniref:NADH-quinone oxidoreductase subunit A n=1 Tax=Gephyromycinifex aptenodytis TaxID=2716227 RepID=UPI0014487401|nr:NADH-quinone oxidoreductase subunit A [Gephyromycinifex aptenodytis]